MSAQLTDVWSTRGRLHIIWNTHIERFGYINKSKQVIVAKNSRPQMVGFREE